MKDEKIIDEEIDKTDFAKAIIKIRAKYKLTQKQLADLIMVSDRTISKWENGITVPDLINIKNICDALNISPNSIVKDKKSIKDYFNLVLRYLRMFLDYVLKNIFIITFIISFILLLVFFINNYNTISLYDIRIDDNSNIRIKSGLLLNSKKQNVLVINNISLKKYDYEIDKINLTLYTYVNGDKYTIYESDNLDNIYIDELNYNDLLSKDVMNSLKKGAIIDINIKDKKNKEYSYSVNLDFYNNYSNNKLFYYNTTDYMQMSSPIYIKNYNESYNKSYEVIDNYKKEDTNNLLASKLKELGYTYNKDNDEYIKEEKDFVIIINRESKYALLKFKKIRFVIFYNFNSEYIIYKTYNADNKNKVYFKYNLKKKYYICKIENCDKYINEMSNYLQYFNEIKDTL